MQVEATTDSPLATDADTVAVGVFETEGIAHDVPGAMLEGLLASGEAQRELGRLAVGHAEGKRFLVVGLGPRERFGAEQARVAAAAAQKRAAELSTEALCWELPHHVGQEIVAGLVQGTLLRAYRFDRYKPESRQLQLDRLIVSAHHDVSEAARVAAIVTAAQNRARDLGNTPANDLPPAELANYAVRLAERSDRLRVTVLDEHAIRTAGMGAFAAVAQGSAQDAQLIRIDYEGLGAAEVPLLGLIGKGITFDSGGLSLKQAASMPAMKFDMCGGAAVIEAIAALAELEAPVHVLGVVGAAENLPGGRAVKPGDIVRALDGTTIEIQNTDAEGRLVLADCLAYARREGAQRLIDIATLTGAIAIALGSTYAGLMSNDDQLAAQVESAATVAGEDVWRMPLHPEYAAMIKGRYAQLTNRTERRDASAITAAELLHHFVGDLPWAHLDIAGVADDVARPYFVGKGASGFGVRLLVETALALTR